MTRALRRGRSKLFGNPEFHTSSHEEAHGTRTVLYTRNGTLTAVSGQDLTFPRGAQVISFWMNVDGPPSGGEFTCDATIDGTTIFSDGDLPSIASGDKEMTEVRIVGGMEAFISDSETLEILPTTINGASGLQVWLEVDMGDSDD